MFLIKLINWRKWSYSLLILLLVIDGACIYIESPSMMIAIRALHGITGGLLVGIGFAIISRTVEPDKTFGYLLLIQFGLGGLGIMFLPGLVPEFGTSVLFLSLMAFTVVTLFMLPFLGDYRITDEDSTEIIPLNINKGHLSLNLFAIFLFQAANMGLFAYMIGLGKVDGLSVEFMSPALGMASWIAIAGTFLVIAIGTKYGRTKPLVIGIIITAISSWVLHYSANENVYLIANVIIGITWAYVLPYVFGICSELDKAGQMAAMGGFASKMGLASGPMIGAFLLGEDNYSLLINIATLALIVCAAVVFVPAQFLDKKMKRT
ncbi:MAG: MFS transporter [Gammaproteobacteria bacterium]|nr:MAG: MFS transporter [Gammaproteobacteria bacterium]